MSVTPRISFQNVEHSEFIEKEIQQKVRQLTRHNSEVMDCHVVVDSPHKSKNKGKIYEIHIKLSVPGNDISVSRDSGLNHSHEDIHVAIRDAFDAAKRILQDRAGKTHDKRTRGPSIKDIG